MKLLLWTWKDLFIADIRQMAVRALVEHRIPAYNVIPRPSKPSLFTQEEIDYQRKMLPSLIGAGVIVAIEEFSTVRKCTARYHHRVR